MRKRTSLILVVELALLAVLGTGGCSPNSKSSETNAAEVPSATVASVTRGNIAHTLNLAGQFQPYQVVDVHAKVSGYIRHIYVDIGDRVRQGQVLAVLEVPELSAQLKGTVAEAARRKDEITRAEHEVLRAESEHAALHADYTRLKQAAAAQPGLIAQQELDDAASKDMATEAQIDSAKAALAAAKQTFAVAGADNERVSALADYTRVTAPLNGVIIWRYADTGALIQAGTSSDVQSLPVVKLSQSDLLRLRLPVPEDDVQYIHVGANVEVRVDAVNRSFTGKVVRFTRNVSLATRTMETEIDVPNKDLSLIPGMYANTTLQLEQRNNVLTVPVQAVIKNGNQASVLVLDDQNRVRVRNITLGLQGSTLVEVKAGLTEGERVINGGQSKYQPGEEVKPRLEHLPPNDTNTEQSEERQQ
jgi:RND family efflux transporter MFP subunit